MCSFSAKGPWCVVVDGVPYGAYTEGQATKITGLILKHHPDKSVVTMKMQKFDDAATDYPDWVLVALRPTDSSAGHAP